MSLRPSGCRVISGHHTLGHAAPPRINRSEDRETASTSASGDDFDDLFDWERYDADCGQETDVTAPSEISAEGNHLAASASVGDRPSDSDGDIQMADAEMPEPPHPFLWPAVDPDQPPREGSLSIEGQAGPSRPFPQPHSKYPARRQPHTMHTQKRSRVLESPEETNQVRDAGACYHCRMNKSKCSLGVCEWCKKQPFPELACIRKPMPNILGSIFSRWNFTETLRRDDLNESKHGTLFISFSGKADSPCLKLTVAPFKGSARFGISSSATPSETQILEWAKAQMVWESKHGPGFESRLDSFHLEHVRGKELERMLLPNLLRMKQMWKVWSCKAFFVHQRPGYAAERQLGSDYSSIQDCLRHIAGMSISQLERSIIKDVEDYFKKDKSVAPSSRIALDISKWLALWQLISIYRQSLRLMLQQEHTDAAPLAMGVTDNYSERRRSFRTTTEDLLRGIVVIYYDLFHKRTTIQAIRNPSSDVFGLSKTKLYDAFKQVLSANTEFYKQVLSQNITDDQFFIEYLIKRELKVLNSAKRR